MKEATGQLARTKQSAMKTLYAAFKILQENNGELSRKALLEEMTNRISFEPWELERYESNQQLKWLTVFLFYTIDCIKAGWLIKNKGVWYITPEGIDAFKLGPQVMFETASKAYRDWKSNEDKISTTTASNDQAKDDINITDTQLQQATNDELTAQANEGLGRYLEAIYTAKILDGICLYQRSDGSPSYFIATDQKAYAMIGVTEDNFTTQLLTNVINLRSLQSLYEEKVVFVNKNHISVVVADIYQVFKDVDGNTLESLKKYLFNERFN